MCPGEGLAFTGAELVRRRVLPVHIVARFPAVMRNMVDLDASLAGRGDERTQIVEQVHFLRHILDPRPQLAAFAQKIVVEIDAQQRRDLRIIGCRHDGPLMRTGPALAALAK